MRFLLIISLLCFIYSAKSQDEIFSYSDFILRVSKEHPIAQQANLKLQEADAIALKYRAGFDPKIAADLAQKYYDGKQYYSHLDAGLKVPTWFGLSFQGGYNQTGGTYLNPELNTPDNGLVYAGITWNLGEGLFFDERRLGFRQAELYRNSTQIDREIILNKLLFEASLDYWAWFVSYHQYKVYENAVQVAEERYRGVVNAVILGDRPPIDSTEAVIQVQNRKILLAESNQNLYNARLKLSVHLWDKGIVPLELDSTAIPENVDLSLSSQLSLENFKLDSILSNPIIEQKRLKIQALELERRWAAEQLKPNLDLKYNLLSEPISGGPNLNYNDYNWGLSFSMPIFVRKERAQLALSKIVLQEQELDLNWKSESLKVKVLQSMEKWRTSHLQNGIYSKTVNDYEQLWNAETTLFNSGESSLFMVNSRETKFLNAEIKYIEMLAKNRMYQAETLYLLFKLEP